MATFDLAVLLLELVVIVGGALLFRSAAARLRQPTVLGDLLFGVAVGPTLLGRYAPEWEAALFPQGNRPVLEALGWIGLVLFLFVAGAEMRWKRTENRAILLVAAGGLVVPLSLGLGLAAARPGWFFDGPADPARTLLVAVVLTVSAISVLARLLDDERLLDHPLGTITMGAGTVDDAVAWIVLALVAGSATGGLARDPLLSLALLAALALALAAAHGVLARRLRDHGRAVGPLVFPALLLGVFAAAWLTHAAGLHAFLGPLAVGALVSRRPALREYTRTRLGDVTLLVFLPTFFVMSGREVDLGLLALPDGWLALAVVLAVASAGKVAGAYLGARAANMTHAAALITGILLNARGAVGLVVAKVGLDVGLLSPSGYALIVVVVILSTVMAPPALRTYVRHLGRRARIEHVPARPR